MTIVSALPVESCGLTDSSSAPGGLRSNPAALHIMSGLRSTGGVALLYKKTAMLISCLKQSEVFKTKGHQML